MSKPILHPVPIEGQHVSYRESSGKDNNQYYGPKQYQINSQIYITEVLANQNNQTFENFLKQTSNLSRIPFIRSENKETLNILFYENRCQTKQLENIVESIYKNYNFKDSEVLNHLKEQLLFGIQAMGFKNTKINAEAKKVTFLYAINDNCNNLNSKVSTFPILMAVNSKFIELKIIFAVDCKPGIFVDQGLLKSTNLSSLFLMDKKHKNISNILPITSKFSNSQKLKTMSLDYGPFYYLKLVLFLIKEVNKHLKAWKFIFDFNKNQIYCRLVTRVLFPLTLNRHLPQNLTSEGIIYFTSVAHGLYLIYDMKQKGVWIERDKVGEWMKNLVEDIKNKLKKPIIPFSLEDTQSNKKHFSINLQSDKDIFRILEKQKKCKKIFFCGNPTKGANEDIIIFINPSDVNLDKNIADQDINIKIMNQIRKLYKELYTNSIILDFNDLKENFCITNKHIFYKYTKNLSDILRIQDKHDDEYKEKYNNIERIINALYKKIIYENNFSELNDLKINDYIPNSGKYRGMKVLEIHLKYLNAEPQSSEIYSELDQIEENEKDIKNKNKVTFDRLMLNSKYFYKPINRHIGYIKSGIILVEDYGIKFSDIAIHGMNNKNLERSKNFRKHKSKIDDINLYLSSIKNYKIVPIQDCSYLKIYRAPNSTIDLQNLKPKWKVNIKFDILSRFEEKPTTEVYLKNLENVKEIRKLRVPAWLDYNPLIILTALNESNYILMKKDDFNEKIRIFTDEASEFFRSLEEKRIKGSKDNYIFGENNNGFPSIILYGEIFKNLDKGINIKQK